MQADPDPYPNQATRVVTEAQNSNSKFKLELELMKNPNF